MCKKLLEQTTNTTSSTESKLDVESASTHTNHSDSYAHDVCLFAIQHASVVNTNQKATLFFDSGSNSTYISHSAAKILQAQKLKPVVLDVTTMGGNSKSYKTSIYQIRLKTSVGEIATLRAYGMVSLTGPVTPLDKNIISQIFPSHDPTKLERCSSPVDILVGIDYYNLHPRTEVDQAGNNFYILEGVFGPCLAGSHPRLKEHTQLDNNLVSEVITRSAVQLCEPKHFSSRIQSSYRV